jgi:hypothetical protein
MMNYLETATFWDIVGDVAGVVTLFAFIFMFPYIITFMKVIFE